MVEDWKAIRDRFIKSLLMGFWGPEGDTADLKGVASELDDATIRDFIIELFEKASKSASEISRVLGHEIGMTFAAMLKEPLSQLAKSQKLQITIELVPKVRAQGEPQKEPKATPVKKTAKKKDAEPKATGRAATKKSRKASRKKPATQTK